MNMFKTIVSALWDFALCADDALLSLVHERCPPNAIWSSILTCVTAFYSFTDVQGHFLPFDPWPQHRSKVRKRVKIRLNNSACVRRNKILRQFKMNYLEPHNRCRGITYQELVPCFGGPLLDHSRLLDVEFFQKSVLLATLIFHSRYEKGVPPGLVYSDRNDFLATEGKWRIPIKV